MAGLLSIAVVVAWFLAARWLAKKLTSRLKVGLLRTVLMSVAVLVLMVLPVADEIIGGFQFRALCKEHAVLKVNEEKIKGKTIRVVIDPSNRDVDNAAVRIYYSRFSYRDTTSNEELATYSRYVAVSGWLLRTITMSESFPPLTIHPSACNLSDQGNLAKKYEFAYQLKSKEK